MLEPSIERDSSRLPRDMADDELVNALSQYLELEPVEKQALLERAGAARTLPHADRAHRDEGAAPAAARRRAAALTRQRALPRQL